MHWTIEGRRLRSRCETLENTTFFTDLEFSVALTTLYTFQSCGLGKLTVCQLVLPAGTCTAAPRRPHPRAPPFLRRRAACDRQTTSPIKPCEDTGLWPEVRKARSSAVSVGYFSAFRQQPGFCNSSRTWVSNSSDDLVVSAAGDQFSSGRVLPGRVEQPRAGVRVQARDPRSCSPGSRRGSGETQPVLLWSASSPNKSLRRASGSAVSGEVSL